MTAGFPGFKRGITIAFFQRSGTNSLEFRILKRCRALSLLMAQRLHSTWIWSRVVDLFLRFLRECYSSLMVKIVLGRLADGLRCVRQ